jgi:hypothetical protein
VGITARYAALLLGGIGTFVATLSAFGLLLSWPLGQSLHPVSLALFVIAAVSGVGQWWFFSQRRFEVALVLFALTLTSWALAAWSHTWTSVDCSAQPCVLSIHLISAKQTATSPATQ